jgi:selenocysteine lyase/cysteine desulfurase
VIDPLDVLRTTEYGGLDAGGHVYLDYTGAGLPARAQLHAHQVRLESGYFGNPHSENPTSLASTDLVERTRTEILAFFNAPETDYTVIFTPNATGACRLVGEAYPFSPGKGLVLLADNHNSVNGLREYARSRHAQITYVPLREDLRADEPPLEGEGLLAYPAQSNFTGVQHPAAWIEKAHAQGYDVLLDAAAYVPANRLDLTQVKPDFVPVSFYKMFGYPTGVGCLIARRESLARLRRPWFSGGTIHAVSALGGWHVMAPDQTAFEDGTLNFLSIPDVRFGLSWLQSIGIDAIHRHVQELTGRLLSSLRSLTHRDGGPLIRLYGPYDMDRRGGTVAFNIIGPDGGIVDERAVARDSAAARISLRTGCFCNPGAGEAAFALDEKLLKTTAEETPRSLDDYLDILGLDSAGAIRVSLGIASNQADLDRLLDFLTETYADVRTDLRGLTPRERC